MHWMDRPEMGKILSFMDSEWLKTPKKFTKIKNSVSLDSRFVDLENSEERLPPGEESVSPSHYALLLRQRMEAAYHHVRSQLSLQQRQQKTLYDRKVAGAPYCVGDLVLLHPQP